MNTATTMGMQQQAPQPIPIKGGDRAKKKPPRFIENMIDKVEEILTKPANPQPQQETQPSTVADEVNEVALPKGTTITLPDGKAFETQTESKLSKT